MIIENKKLIETSGTFEDEIEMQVNTSNTGKLFELLISSYKNARASMIRETVSNAYDAQIEAGNTEEPVVVNINYDDSGWFLEVIDKGIGMTKEFVEKIYSSLLSSTKDKNNEQIGGFGIKFNL